MRDAAGHRAIAGPDHGAGERQAIAERVVLHVARHAAQIPALLAAEHRRNAQDRHQEARHDQPVGALTVEEDGGQHREAWPEIVDHADLDGLPAAVGIADGQRQAQLVRNEQQAAPDQVGTRQRADADGADGEPQQPRGHRVDQRRPAGGAKALADAPDQADDRTPEEDRDQPDQRGLLSAMRDCHVLGYDNVDGRSGILIGPGQGLPNLADWLGTWGHGA
ncbi:hypothetical protein D3C87_1406280 [compost metagenome]